MRTGLPCGWTSERLREIVVSRKGKKPTTVYKQGAADRVPYILIDEMEGKPIRNYTDDAKVPLASKEDVLIVWDGSIGKCARGLEGAIGSTIVALTPIGIDSNYLESFIKFSRPLLLQTSRGTGLQHINQEIFWDLRVPVAPIEEQHRIVAKLEILLAKVEACQKRLNKIPTLLKRFRQSVLAAACSGRLTADWHEVHIEDNPVKRTNILANGLPEVPETWCWVKLPKTGEMSRGKSRHRPRNAPFLLGGSYPFIQTGDIAQSGGRITSHKHTYSEAGLAQSRLWPAKTVCITIAANIAESALLTYPACFPDSVVGIITDRSKCLPEFLEFFIRTAKSDLSTFAPATAQKNINIKILSDVLVPLPPLPEQHEIVRRVEALFKIADPIEDRYKKASAYVDKLTQSILAKTFRGELVPQDPTDEPASELLARIKEERAKILDRYWKKS